MEIDRRTFIGSLVSLAIAKNIPIPTEFNWIPHPKQLEFLNKSEIFMVLSGASYHQSPASMGQWLGIPCSESIRKELTEMIVALESNKK